MAAGRLVLGGCTVTGDDPNRHCNDCQHRWRSGVRARGGGRRWAWAEGPVDRSKSHLELRYGSAGDSGWDKWLPVARVGPPRDRTFPVEWIVDRADPAHREAADAVAKELDFYLVEKGEADPWAYAAYHSGTTSNAYSQVHWALLGETNPPSRQRKSAR
jgi:hypothetical protein